MTCNLIDVESVLNMDYIDGPDYNFYHTNVNDNESVILESFKKVYHLLGVKSKKNRKLDYQLISNVGLHLITQINKWNSKAIINILMDIEEPRDNQNIFLLNSIEYLIQNNVNAIRFHLIILIERVSDLSHSFRENISTMAINILNQLLKCSNNSDLDPFIPVIIDSLQNPDNIPKAIEKLAGCVFVQNVEFPALAVILPILEKGLKNPITENKRKSCVIIDNMCKLVNDPKEIYPLLPNLLPLINKCVESISNPEARNIAEKTLHTLKKTCGDDYQFISITPNDIKQKLSSLLKNKYLDNKINYICLLVSEMANSSYFVLEEWCNIFNTYLLKEKEDIECISKKLMQELESVNKKEEIRFEDTEEGLDLYKGEFSLAYGALTLLNNTYLHLKRNRFYGLLGPNNCGKTTLMRAIANEQVEGFPKRDELKTIFVEHEIQEREIGKDEVGMPILNIDLCGIDWVVDCCNEVYQMEPKVNREDVEKVMEDIGFGYAILKELCPKSGLKILTAV